jgi:hypothetical protein
VADGLRKCSGHDEHHVTLYTYVTLYISKSRPALAGVVDRAPLPMLDTSIMILRRHSPLYAFVCLYFGQSVMPRRVSCELSLFHLLANRMRKSSKSSGPSIHGIRVQVRVTLLIGTKEPQWSVFGHTWGMPCHMASVVQIVSKAGSRHV